MQQIAGAEWTNLVTLIVGIGACFATILTGVGATLTRGPRPRWWAYVVFPMTTAACFVVWATFGSLSTWLVIILALVAALAAGLGWWLRFK